MSLLDKTEGHGYPDKPGKRKLFYKRRQKEKLRREINKLKRRRGE